MPINGISLRDSDVPGWLLSPWSKSPDVWSRMIVLYSFGLSIHYFIWLKAIPETASAHQNTNSWKETFRLSKQICGTRTFDLLLFFAVISTGVWLYNHPLGKLIYFRVAGLHGWTEATLLIVTAASGIVNIVQSRLGIRMPLDHMIPNGPLSPR